MSEPRDPLSEWIADFVRTERDPDMVEAWVERTTGAITQGMPQLHDDPLLLRDLRLAVEAQWRSFLEELHQPTNEFHLVPAAKQLAVSCAQRQLPLEELLKIYRLAQMESWDYVTGLVKSVPREDLDLAELLERFWGMAVWWIDSSIGASIEQFQTERHRIERGAAARRLALVESVLAGNDVAPAKLSAGLGGYPVSGFHTALVLFSTDFEVAESLESMGRRVARALGASQPLVIQPAGRELWVWVATTREPASDELHLTLDDGGHPEATVLMGTPQEGLDGFRTSHREARATQQLMLRHGVRAPFVGYEDVELLVLLSKDEDAARRFTERVLADLGEDTESAERLRETVLTLLRSGGSLEDVAQTLSVHKNTVRYRVGKAEEILGRSVQERAGELETALRYHRLMESSRL